MVAEGQKPLAGEDPKVADKAGDKDARPVSLAFRHVFGLKNNVKGNVSFTDEKHVLYPAGHNTILYQTDIKTQTRVFPGTEHSEGITCLAVSPNRKFLAVCERLHDKAICSIFDIHTGKRRRNILTFPDCDAREFVCAQFSADNKFLITQGGPPDWTLVSWSWDKAKPQGHVKVSNMTGSVIHECSFNPQDSNVVCVVGDGVFKFLKLQEGQLKSQPNGKLLVQAQANQNYVCHAWLYDNKLVVCSEAGDALLFDTGGEFKTVLLCSPGEHRSLLCITAFGKGFIAGGDGGIIRVYEKADDPKELFKKAREVKLDVTSSGGVAAAIAMAISPTEETLAIATSNAQLLQMSLSSSDILKAEESAMDHVLTSFHSGPILGLDVCIRKQLVATCGVDRSVRIWNYFEKTQEQCKFFGEEAYSIAFHPSGFHLIVGFSDKLRLMNVIMEDIRTYRELPIKGCRECRFSHGGQFFAAVNSNTVQVYRTYTCEVVCNLRGHQSKVRSVCWTRDDDRIVSTGQDGFVYEHDIIKEGRRVSEWTQKGTNFSCVIAHTDAATQSNTMYVVGADKMLKEVAGNQLTNYLECNLTLGQLALAGEERGQQGARALFAGVAEPDMPGPLRCYSFPLDGDCTEYQAHSAPVTRIRITQDDQYLFSAGEDGCLCIFEVKKKEVPAKRDKDGGLQFAEEILVTKAFLDEKQAALLELERQVEELTSKIDFQLRHRDSYHKEQMTALQEKYSEETDDERRKYEVLREEKAELETQYEDNVKALQENHSKTTQELEQSFAQKMRVEMQSFKKLESDLEREKQEWKQEYDRLQKEHQAVILKMRDDAEKKQQLNRDGQERILFEKEQTFKQHAKTLQQLDEDADREIEELKEMYEQKLAHEKKEKVRLRGAAGIYKKHYEDLRRLSQKKEKEVEEEFKKNQKAEAEIEKLKKDKESHEKEIKERDKTIQDKELRIYDLKKQNQELEKFKFVLDYKIKELKAQIDPKTADIASMKTQTQAMDDELNEYMRKNKDLALRISQLQMKQRALQEEIKSQRHKLKEDLALIRKFKLDVSDCMECSQEPKTFKESVAALYRKYVQVGVKKLDLDTDMQKEYNRQRDYLEKSVESLKRKIEKDSQAHRIDNMRIMQENVSLIREINLLRREINSLRHEKISQDLQSIPQTPGKDGTMTAQQADKELSMQREEIEALTRHLLELEANAPRPPSAGGRILQGTLPPVPAPAWQSPEATMIPKADSVNATQPPGVGEAGHELQAEMDTFDLEGGMPEHDGDTHVEGMTAADPEEDGNGVGEDRQDDTEVEESTLVDDQPDGDTTILPEGGDRVSETSDADRPVS